MSNPSPIPRSSAAVTKAVWKALFFREAHIRIFGGRAAWVWLLLEPVAQVLVIVAIIGQALKQITFGVDGSMFLMTGLLSYQVAMNTATRSMNAIGANAALFGYRQVKPADTVIVRAFMELAITCCVALILLSAAALLGFDIIPADPLQIAAVFAVLFVMGLGLGLMLSVATQLVPEVAHIATLFLKPLYFISGVMFPAMAVPAQFRDLAMLNPLMHALEIARSGFFEAYKAVPEANLGYPATIALFFLFFGLALHVRFASRLFAL